MEKKELNAISKVLTKKGKMMRESETNSMKIDNALFKARKDSYNAMNICFLGIYFIVIFY